MYSYPPSPTPTPGKGSNSVSISGMAFSPASLTVAAGKTITWTNNDAIAHTVTSDTGLFDSGAISATGGYGGGGTYSYTFATAGTYNYHCNIHPMMTAKIIVQ
jgi:plastocyanin